MPYFFKLYDIYSTKEYSCCNESSLFSKYTYTDITVGYTEYQKLLPFISANKIEVTNQDFTDQVHLSICTKEADTARFIEEMTELCYGRIVFCEEKTIFECKNL